MITTNTETVPGYRVSEVLGIVQGNSVRTRNMVADMAAGIKGVIGGEVHSYTILLTRTRQEAYTRMRDEGEQLGADAIINVRFSTSMIAESMSEMLVYGTAVKLVASDEATTLQP